jgi:predicted RNA-binding Zn-ribbon protein involved in translation (DUF1610 family)
MPLEDGDMKNIVPPPNVEPKTAEEVNRKAEGEVGIKQGFGRAEQARVVTVGSTGSTCPNCGQNTLKADMRRKVNRVYCTNCEYDMANPGSGGGVVSTGGMKIVSGRGVQSTNEPERQGTKIISNKRPS